MREPPPPPPARGLSYRALPMLPPASASASASASALQPMLPPAPAFGMWTPTPAATSGVKRSRSTRLLFHAEQVMEDKKQPKKKYLATQRLRRDMERSTLESMHLDVNALKQQIADLRSMRGIIENQRLTIRSTQTACRLAIVSRYWEMLEHGIGNESKRAVVTRRMKESFLRSIMAEDLRFGLQCGISLFIDQCSYYTLFHSKFHYETPEMKELPAASNEPVVVCRNRLRVRVSRTTIQQIFPHLLADEELVQKLIGRELEYPCEIRIYFDANGKIVRHDAAVDFVEGLNAVLHSLPRVVSILNGAQLTHGAVIVRR